MLNRRGFLTALAGAFVADPDRLLWVPGKKLISVPKVISVPKPRVVTATVSFRLGDIVTIPGFNVVDPVTRKATNELRKFIVTEGLVLESYYTAHIIS